MRSLDQLDISGLKLPKFSLKPMAQRLSEFLGLPVALAPDMVHEAHQEDTMSFISTGGVSFLEFFGGKERPAFTALKECGA